MKMNFVPIVAWRLLTISNVFSIQFVLLRYVFKIYFFKKIVTFFTSVAFPIHIFLKCFFVFSPAHLVVVVLVVVVVVVLVVVVVVLVVWRSSGLLRNWKAHCRQSQSVWNGSKSGFRPSSAELSRVEPTIWAIWLSSFMAQLLSGLGGPPIYKTESASLDLKVRKF